MADLILASLQRCGWGLEPGARALDFGCSSGRHLRVLELVRPDVEWLGCDPNRRAIEWAQANLPRIGFTTSPTEPPLAVPDRSLDLVVAVSIWSHFDSGAAVAWLAEMERVLRPGGALLLTALGLHGLAVHAAAGDIHADDARGAAATLHTRGFRWVDLFGKTGDWGVRHPEWGLAYLTPEWLLARALPGWRALLYEPARLGGCQDLYVLQRAE